MAMKPIGVSQLNAYIKRILQTDPVLSQVSVLGEISNLKYHDSGHERVLFERIMAQYESSEKAGQSLLIPFYLNCSISAVANWEEWMDEIAKIGFSLSLFGPNTLLVKEIPNFMELDAAQRFLSDFMCFHSSCVIYRVLEYHNFVALSIDSRFISP